MSVVHSCCSPKPSKAFTHPKIGKCQIIVIETQVTGSGGRPFTSVQWKISGPSQLNSKILKQISDQNSKKNLNLVLMAEDFENYFGDILFSISVINWFGMNATQTIKIKRSVL